MPNNAKVAGVLDIVCGAMGVLGVLGIVFVILVISTVLNQEFPFYDTSLSPEAVANLVTFVYTLIGVFLALLSALAITGGVYALQKKYWGLALAGAIAGTFIFLPCGVVAIVFTAMAKPEFTAGKLPPAPV
jgi:hypothetical protein